MAMTDGHRGKSSVCNGYLEQIQGAFPSLHLLPASWTSVDAPHESITCRLDATLIGRPVKTTWVRIFQITDTPMDCQLASLMGTVRTCHAYDRPTPRSCNASDLPAGVPAD
ncbi:hypothetical protein XANCAGTX0491_006870 [Xanthoria calcicola]